MSFIGIGGMVRAGRAARVGRAARQYSGRRGSGRAMRYGRSAGRFAAHHGDDFSEMSQEMAEQAREEAAEVVGREAFVLALELTGNEGQLSIIEIMTEMPFIEAALAAANDEDPLVVLEVSCRHPEAVTIILEEASLYMHEQMEGLGV